MIRVTGGGLRQNFTVRRDAWGRCGATFMIHSPRIDKIDVLRHGDGRPALLPARKVGRKPMSASAGSRARGRGDRRSHPVEEPEE